MYSYFVEIHFAFIKATWKVVITGVRVCLFFSVHQEFKLASLNTQPSPKCFSRVCLSCKTQGMSFGLFCRENQAKVHLNNSQQNDSRGKS